MCCRKENRRASGGIERENPNPKVEKQKQMDSEVQWLLRVLHNDLVIPPNLTLQPTVNQASNVIYVMHATHLNYRTVSI